MHLIKFGAETTKQNPDSLQRYAVINRAAFQFMLNAKPNGSSPSPSSFWEEMTDCEAGGALDWLLATGPPSEPDNRWCSLPFPHFSSRRHRGQGRNGEKCPFWSHCLASGALAGLGWNETLVPHLTGHPRQLHGPPLLSGNKIGRP